MRQAETSDASDRKASCTLLLSLFPRYLISTSSSIPLAAAVIPCSISQSPVLRLSPPRDGASYAKLNSLHAPEQHTDRGTERHGGLGSP